MKIIWTIYTVLFCCLLLPMQAAAKRPYTPIIADPIVEPWRWQNEQALEGFGIVCMDQAADGTLWFGASGSIIRYDGVTVTAIEFDEDLLSTISHQKKVPWANTLLALPDGTLLVLIGESLMLRSGDEWSVIIPKVGASVFTANLKRAPDGTCWLVLPDAIWRINADLTEASILMRATEFGFLGSLCLDETGQVWVVEKIDQLHAQLVSFPKEFISGQKSIEPQTYPLPVETGAREIRIEADPNGMIWYADDDHRTSLATFDPDQKSWTLRDDCPRARFFSLSRGHDGTIWAGGEKMLVRIPPQGQPILYSQSQLKQPQVPLSVYESDHQQLWVIGRVGYVHSVDIGNQEWLTYENLHLQCETPDGIQWFNTWEKDAVIQYDPRTEKWLRYGTSDGLIDTINAIAVSSHGLIWAVGSHNGRAALSVFEEQQWRRILHPKFAESIEPNAILEAADGTMWFGAGGNRLTELPSAGGALQYEVDQTGTARFLRHHAPPEFPYYVTAFAQSTDQSIWVGSIANSRYDATRGKIEYQADLRGINTVGMAFDQEQALWLGKEDAGVYQFKNGNWKLFSTRDGLAGARVSALKILQDNSVLAATGDGISRFDGHSWTTHAYPAEWTMSSRWCGILGSADGSVWFNFIDKEDRNIPMAARQVGPFYTVRHRAEKTPPDTKINDYLERVSQPGNSHITWSAQDPWSRTPREALSYSWRLDGNDWSPFLPETGHTFLKLSSGRHRLEVRSRDIAFNIDPTPARIEFSVIPPLWKQPWFLVLLSGMIGLIVSLLWLLIRSREKYLLQQQQEREAHLQELDRMKTGFFTNISHELRTPLTVISGRLETIINEELTKDIKDALSIVVRNVGRMSALITQLLDFRKIEEGTIKEEAIRGDLATALNDWVSSMQVLAEKKQVHCRLEHVTECPGSFDFDKIQKIFTNLISNAIKYTEVGGEILIKLTLDETDPHHRQVCFSVEDNGIGIPEEHLGAIFDRFYRIPESSMASGAGIGLNLTRELVHLLGGDIQVESPIYPDSDRPGTRFAVVLPLKQEHLTEEVQIQRAQKSTKLSDTLPTPGLGDKTPDSPLILIVEDDDDIRNFIVEGLEPTYRVETAENGQTGLDIAIDRVPDLIVTDLMMPVMDGVEMCRKLKTSMETSHIPVVMLTAKASLEHQLEGLKNGADDYVTKPFHMELLQVRIANLLESRRIMREKFSKEYAALPPALPQNSLDNEFIEKATNVLEEQYADGVFQTERFASALNMSHRSLQRKLKAVTNRTPKEFINEFRLARAAELLINTSDTIAEVAYKIGIDEPSNFTRLFKSHFKITPSQYRSKQK